MPGKRWTSAEKESLQRQLITEHRSLEAVEIPGRTLFAIRSQSARLGLIELKPPRLRWSPEQMKLLKQYKREGLTPLHVFQFDLLGEPYRSIWAITKKWGRMKLADRTRSRCMQNKKQWKAGEKQEFVRFLKKQSQRMTPEEIGNQWNLARSTVSRIQTKHRLKATREDVLLMKYSLAKQERARRRIRRDNIRNWDKRRQQREKEMLASAEQLRLTVKRLEERRCEDCQRPWPKRREFFHINEKKISIGTSRYFKRRCVLCENKRRRLHDQKKKRRETDPKG